MSGDNISDLILERLNRLSERLNKLDSIENDISVLKESVRRIDSRIGAIDSHMAGFHSTLNWHSDEIDSLRGRVEDIETDKPVSD